MITRSVLIIDRDEKFLSYIAASIAKSDYVPSLCNNQKDAERVILNLSQTLFGIFINPNIGATETVMTIRACRQFRPSTPVYFLQDGKIEFEESVLMRLGIQSVLKKPIDYSTILACTKLSMAQFENDLDEGNLIEAIKSTHSQYFENDKTTESSEFQAADTDFVPVKIGNIFLGATTLFAYYLKIGSGRYKKVFHAKETLSKEIYGKYIKRGVTHFYIEKDAQEKYLLYCETLITTLVSRPSVGLEKKLEHTLSFGTEITDFYSRMGVYDQNLGYAHQFIKQVDQLTKQMKPESYPRLLDFVKDTTAFDHGVGVAFTASLIMQQLDIVSADPVETIGLACLFHDIGLKNILVRFSDEDESLMNEEELKIYRTHPKESALLLRGIPSIKDAAIQGIEQHHMRRNKTGFPKLTGAATLGFVGEIVGMSDEILRIVKEVQENPRLDFENLLERRVYPAFYHKLVAGFKKVFLKRAA